MKNSSDTLGNRTRDLPVCNTVPQPTAPPCNPLFMRTRLKAATKKYGKAQKTTFSQRTQQAQNLITDCTHTHTQGYVCHARKCIGTAGYESA
jgi:hypothetical protein